MANPNLATNPSLEPYTPMPGHYKYGHLVLNPYDFGVIPPDQVPDWLPLPPVEEPIDYRTSLRHTPEPLADSDYLDPKIELKYMTGYVNGIAMTHTVIEDYLDNSFKLHDGLRARTESAYSVGNEIAAEHAGGIDAKTGAYLPKVLIERYLRLQAQFKEGRSRRRGGDRIGFPAYSLLLIDLDHYKKVNDTYGHIAGDFVLIDQAEKIRKCLRENDLLIRQGGEEFVALLEGAGTRAAVGTANRIRKAMKAEGTHVPAIGDELPYTIPPQTASIGVKKVDFHAELDANLHDADLAMYAAKEAGRDRTVSASQLKKKPA